MNTDNLSAMAVGIGVVALIVGFGIYFNSPDLNKIASSQHNSGNGSFVPATTTTVHDNNGKTVTKVQIDRSQFKLAPELSKISGYINTTPIKLSDLKGKVVLVDFWTYSCINCIRTIPYLNAWYEKYASQGLVIVGVHTPEFEFEKNYDNVKAAVERFGIKYPVVQDNDKGTWEAYQNRYWPHKYLIDEQGYIRYDHIGEGGYSDTEKIIQSLLAERAASMGANVTIDKSISNPQNAQSVDFNKIYTPELYFGYQYARQSLGNPEGFKPDQVVKYTTPSDSNLVPNTIYLDGQWKNNPDNMELQGNEGHIVIVYSAKAANIVAGGQGQVQVSEDGRGGSGSGNNNSSSNNTTAALKSQGSDVSGQGQVVINGQKLYNVAMHDQYGEHKLVLDIKGKGFQIYTFTFG